MCSTSVNNTKKSQEVELLTQPRSAKYFAKSYNYAICMHFIGKMKKPYRLTNSNSGHIRWFSSAQVTINMSFAKYSLINFFSDYLSTKKFKEFSSYIIFITQLGRVISNIRSIDVTT